MAEPVDLLHRVAAPIKRTLPRWIWAPGRRILNAILAPVLFSRREGHFRSSLKDRAVDRNGKPIPWYTYPAIAFLRERDYLGRRVLEIGAGQSTLWWARRAESVLSLEENREWVAALSVIVPGNVDLRYVAAETPESCVDGATRELDGSQPFDVVIIDGMWRRELITTCLRYLAPGGILVCDDADGYGFHQALSESGLLRVDFYGMKPTGVGQYCTSVFFLPDSWAFHARHPISKAGH